MSLAIPPVGVQDIRAARDLLAGVVTTTPVARSRVLSETVGGPVWFKCENLQHVGAFKFRGAFNALSQLKDSKGVVAFSSGNHAQAVALSGKLLGIKTVIVMPHDAPQVKLEATRGYGAEVVQYIKHEDRESLAAKLASERGLTLIPPFDHPHIIAGQGTAAKELIEDVGLLDVLANFNIGTTSNSAIYHRRLLPAAALTGAVFMVLVDLAARTVERPNELPLSIVTAAVGAPFFVWLLRRQGRTHEEALG